MITLTWPDRDQNEIKDYEIDFGALLTPVSDTVAGSSWVSAPSGLTLTPTFSGVITRVSISGGTAGTIYTLTNTITTTGGRTIEQPVRLSVIEKTSAVPGFTPVYGTMAGWIAYAANRGTQIADSAENRAALVRAGDYIKFRYVANLNPAYDDTLEVVELATYLAADRERATPGFFTTSYTPAQQKVLTEVKGIKWQVVGGDKNNWRDMVPTDTMIDAMFAPYVVDERRKGALMMAVG